MASTEYSAEELSAIYELGRLYYEMGYLPSAERIFNGICAVSNSFPCARLALGLIKIERGLSEEAVRDIRLAMPYPQCEIEAKVALCASFIAGGERQRAQSLIRELRRSFDTSPISNGEVSRLFEALEISCQ